MEREDPEQRVDEAIEEMRSDVEELEQRRDEVEQHTEESRTETQRLHEGSPRTAALRGDENEDEDEDEGSAAEEASPKDG
jgi:hypothetical protein